MSDVINFMTIGDKNFFDIIQISVRQIRRLYPKSTFYVYDWGFTPEQLTKLGEYSGVHIVEWKRRFADTSSLERVDWVDVMRLHSASANRGGTATVTQVVKRFAARFLPLKSRRLRFERLVFQKPFCTLDCLQRNKGPLVFLDGDAFLYNTIDEVFENSFDVGVTVRRLNELNFEKHQCQVINSGVLFFGDSGAKSMAFVKRWIAQMEIAPEYCVDQTALTRMIHKANPDIFNAYGSTGELATDAGEVSVLTFACDTYNFNWIEEGVESSTNKILHFKGSRHKRDKLNELLAAVEIVSE